MRERQRCEMNNVFITTSSWFLKVSYSFSFSWALGPEPKFEGGIGPKIVKTEKIH